MHKRPGSPRSRVLPLMKDLNHILEGCRKNDRLSQEKLYRQFFPAMYALCKKFFSDPHQIQSCLNNGMLRVFKNINQFNTEKGEFFNWMYTIVRHSCLTTLRDTNKNDIEIVMENIPETPDDRNDESFKYETIIGKLDLLPQSTRTVFMLFYVEEFSIKEIREQLNLSDGTVKWHLNQGRNRLKKYMAQL